MLLKQTLERDLIADLLNTQTKQIWWLGAEIRSDDTTWLLNLWLVKVTMAMRLIPL